MAVDSDIYYHLQNVLSLSELSNISINTAKKLNKYIDEKFDEYLTLKAKHQTGISQIEDKIAESDAKVQELNEKYEDAKVKITSLENINNNLLNEINLLNSKLETSQEKKIQFENDIISLKSSCESASHERNELTKVLERQHSEIGRLRGIISDLTLQLEAGVEAKCEVLTLNNELQRKDFLLQQSEKRMEQERLLLNSQISSLLEEVNRLTNESQTVNVNNSSKLLYLETKFKETAEELIVSNKTITQLNETNKSLNIKIDILTQRLREQTDLGEKTIANYKKELDIKSKTTDLYKSLHVNTEVKANELLKGVSELKNLLKIATDKYGELETKYKQAVIDYDTEIGNNNEVISSLKDELEHANDLLTSVNNKNFTLNDLSPSLANKVIKSGMTLTQIYTELVNATNKLTHEQEESERLKITVNGIVQEFEEKSTVLKKTKYDLQEALETNIILTKQIDSLTIEMNKCRHEVKESSTLVANYKRENLRLEGEMADLQNQICYLLRDTEHRPRTISNGEQYNSYTYMDNNSSRSIVSNNLLQFSDIQELQSNNQKLLRIIKDLTEKLEQIELNKKQFESGEYQQKIITMEQKILELTSAQERHTKMANEIIKQRDLYKKIYHDQTQKLQDISIEEESANDKSTIEMKLIDTQQQLEDVKRQLESCKEENISTEQDLSNHINNLKKEMDKLASENNKNSSTVEYYKEQIKVLQKNITTLKNQLNEMKEKYKESTKTMETQEISLNYFRNAAHKVEQKLSSANILLEKCEAECKSSQDREKLLQSENNLFIREQDKQKSVLKYMESIQNYLVQHDNDYSTKEQSRLKDIKRECTAIRRRLEEEQNEFRKRELHFKEEIQAKHTLLLNEQEKTEDLKREIDVLKLQINNNKQNYNVEYQQPFDNNNESLLLLKKNKELEDIIIINNNNIKSLEEQLLISQGELKIYNNLLENAETGLSKINNEYINYKTEADIKIADYFQTIQTLRENCAGLEAELSLQSNEDTLTTSNIKIELEKTSSDLSKTSDRLQICEQQLTATCTEMERISACLRSSEEKCTQLEITHTTDIQKLNEYQQELSRLQNQIHEITLLKDETLKQISLEKTMWEEKQLKFISDYEKLNLRFINMDTQNTLLLNQIQSLGVQLSFLQASRSLSDSLNESNNSNMNTSVNEDVQLCSEQFLEIVKFLRNEKDFAVSKCNELEAEFISLKSKLDVTQKQLSDAKRKLGKEGDIIPLGNSTLLKHSDIIKKIEALDALTDSNRVLKSERDDLLTQINDLSNTVKNLQEQMSPINNQVETLSNKNESLEAEIYSLKSNSTRWKSRVNALVERTNKTNSEDCKRLQNERDNIAKQLHTEKELNKKNTAELTTLKAERTKLEEQNSSLLRQYNSLVEELKKVNDEFKNVTEESTTLKAEIATTKKNNDRLVTDISNKEKLLTEITTKENRMRKIAIKYKNQYDELLKSIEDDKKKPNESNEDSQLLELQNELEVERANIEKLQSDLNSSIEKETKAKQLLKAAKSKIFQLTETKDNLTRELEKSKGIDNIDQNNKDEIDERLAVIKSQFDSKISKLEKENTEKLIKKEKEIEALLQKINLLQRQLANQTNISKQVNNEKTLTEPPTANIKPMAACATVAASTAGTTRRAGDTPLASIRPVAQVGPTAPHDAHSTEYMPASSSRSRVEEADAAADPGPPPQQVALVLPRVEPPGAAPAGPTGPPAPPADVSTSRAPDRPPKRPRPEPRGPLGKRTRAETDDYQLPTSSQRDRDDDATAADERTPAESDRPGAEVISSGTERGVTLSPGADDGDDGIVPSTPTLYVPRRGDGFGEAAVSPAPAPAESGVRFTFAEAGAASHHDTHADLALPAGEWRDEGAVSSQGSAPASPRHVEEGREAEASAPPADARRRPRWPPLR